MGKDTKTPPKCSMCRNHLGEKAPEIKGHKKSCPYLNDQKHIDTCDKGCLKVQRRQLTVAAEKKESYVSKKLSGNAQNTISPSRARNCKKCLKHGVIAAVKNGHLQRCPYKDCNCDFCEKTNARRRASNEFTKHYRLQSTIRQPMENQAMEKSQNSPDSGFDEDQRSNFESSPNFSPVSNAYSPSSWEYSPTTLFDSTLASDVEYFEVHDIILESHPQFQNLMEIDENELDNFTQIINSFPTDFLDGVEKKLNVNCKFYSSLFKKIQCIFSCRLRVRLMSWQDSL